MSKTLGIALFGGMWAWTAHLLLSYLLADLGCRGESALLVAGRHVTTVVAVAAVIAVTWPMRTYLAGQSSRVQNLGVSAAKQVAGPQAGRPALLERPFLARVALILNVLFLFAIVIAGAMNLFLAPCV